MNTLFMRLQGMQQSYGERGRWTVRDTAPRPTKSAVVGMLGSALDWHDGRLVDLGNALRMGVRVDAQGTPMMDYHTVSGTVKAEGGLRNVPILTHRYYLLGADFMVALQGEPELIAKLETALRSPVSVLYLGRLCCPPSAPVLAGTGDYPSLADALRSETACEIWVEAESGVLRRDRIVSPDMHYFGDRYERRVS